MTMLTIVEAVAIVCAGGGIAIVSFLIGLNQGKRKLNNL